jgi:alkylated DNA repair dioxygenase AlkB
MDDLFGPAPALGLLPMPDAEVLHLGRLALPLPTAELLTALVAVTPWRSDTITLWGKSFLQPRLYAWYGDPGKRYTYSGLTLQPLPWTPLLLDVKAAVEEAARHTFDSVLLNYYRNEHDSMGFHADDEPELGPDPVIASLSLGARRDFVFKHRQRKDLKPVRLPLDDGALIVMRGQTQRHWVHGIEKRKSPIGPRINLTFRTIR